MTQEMERLLHEDESLREAVRRDHADAPQLSADFSLRLHQQLKPASAPRWPWLAAAATVLVLIGVGITLFSAGRHGRTETRTVARVVADTLGTVPGQKVEVAYTQSVEKPAAPVENTPTVEEAVPSEEPVEDSFTPSADASLHYTATMRQGQELERVDSIIRQFAELHNVRPLTLPGLTQTDSGTVCTAYVFPDRKQVDVFGRMLQLACYYDSDTPGYFLNYSRQQLFFSMEDRYSGVRYLWIAERVSDGILLYSSRSPLHSTASSSCYREYYEYVTRRSVRTSQF